MIAVASSSVENNIHNTSEIDLEKSFNSLEISSHLIPQDSNGADDSHTFGTNSLGFSNALIAHIEEARSRLDAWAEAQISTTNTVQEEANAFSKKELNEIREQMKQFETVQRQRGLVASSHEAGDEGNSRESEEDKKNIAKNLTDCKEKQELVEKRLVEVHQKQYEIQTSIDALTKTERMAFQKAEQVRKTKERIEAARAISVEDLTYAVVKYRMTGLDFVKGKNNSLRCVFKQIDKNNPDRAFTFSLKVTEEDMYAVEDCRPKLEKGVVGRLLQSLNDSVDGMDQFPEFIRGMRKAFKNSL